MDITTATQWLDQHFTAWVRQLGIEVDSVACTGAVLSMPVTDAIKRSGGIVAGPALATLTDTAMVVACAGHFKAFRPVATVNLDLQFMRPASGERITCTATILRAGRALIFVRAIMTEEPSGKDVAHATATFAVQ